jgi:hypothetical protein
MPHQQESESTPAGSAGSAGSKGGRPATGRTRTLGIHSYVTEAELAEVKRLARRWDLPLAAVVRRALKEAAHRESHLAESSAQER